MASLEECASCAEFAECADAEACLLASPHEAAQDLVEAVVEWWLCLRPQDFSEADHFANPTINCSNERELAIAEGVAALLRTERDV